MCKLVSQVIYAFKEVSTPLWGQDRVHCGKVNWSVICLHSSSSIFNTAYRAYSVCKHSEAAATHTWPCCWPMCRTAWEKQFPPSLKMQPSWARQQLFLLEKLSCRHQLLARTQTHTRERPVCLPSPFSPQPPAKSWATQCFFLSILSIRMRSLDRGLAVRWCLWLLQCRKEVK